MAIWNCVVYWLYDDLCVCYERHGYIGITQQNPPKRFSQHQYTKGIYRRVPKTFKSIILFRGSVDECDLIERRLRPHKFIGWNILAGGSDSLKLHGTHNFRYGRPMSEEEKQKIRDQIIKRGGINNPIPQGTIRSKTEKANISAGTKAAGPMTSEQRQRQIANTPRGAKHHAFQKPMKITNPMLGKNQGGARNSFFGKRHSEAAKEAIRRARWKHGRYAKRDAKQGQFDFDL